MTSQTEVVRALIVDDEPAARRGMELLLTRQPGFEIAGECADGPSMIEAIEREAPDLVFLDVRMPEMDGFEALAMLPPDRLPHVVFVTAYDRYAVRAFEAHAVDFLLKPYSPERFHEACERATLRIRAERAEDYAARLAQLLGELSDRLPATPPSNSAARRFVVRSPGRVTFVEVDQVLWIAAARDYVRLYTEDASYLIRETMAGIEAALDKTEFVRVHRSTIARVSAIKQVRIQVNGRAEIILPDDTRRAVSRNGRKQLEAVLGADL